MKKTAGILAYRRRSDDVEVFLVHPGGPYWKNKDEHAWSMPKGEFDDEAPEDAARREFFEETGQTIQGDLLALVPIRASGKTIHGFAVATAAPDPDRLSSNTFELEWPPRSGRVETFPEVDRAAWMPLEQARSKIHKAQQGLLDQLEALLEA